MTTTKLPDAVARLLHGYQDEFDLPAGSVGDAPIERWVRDGPLKPPPPPPPPEQADTWQLSLIPTSMPALSGDRMMDALQAFDHESGYREAVTCVLQVLAYYSTPAGCWPRIDTIAARARIHPRTVRRALRTLREVGLIRSVRTGRASRYQLLIWDCGNTVENG